MSRRRSLPVLLLPVLCLGAAGAVVAQEDHSRHGQHPPVEEREPTPTAEQPVEHTAMDHSTMDHSGTEQAGMDHSTMGHSAMGHEPADHAAMGHAIPDGPAPAEPITPIPPLTDADRAAAFPELHHAMHHDSGINSFVLFNRLEGWDADHGRAFAWEGQGWIGSDVNRLWFRTEGEREDSATHSADLELLYGRGVTAWWDVVAGVRQEFQPAGRTWAAIGVQGLAPHMFETQATLYVDEDGRVEANVEVEYELLLTNRLVLQPLVEVNFAARDDVERGVGAGLSTAEAGLRLRYEFTRKFAPYVGLAHERAFGSTADLGRASGEPEADTRWVVGLRTWF